MSKELYIEAHEELVTRYLENHPEATLKEAYEETEEVARNVVRDKYADMIDAAKDKIDDLS